jgi:hypothetical protein
MEPNCTQYALSRSAIQKQRSDISAQSCEPDQYSHAAPHTSGKSGRQLVQSSHSNRILSKLMAKQKKAAPKEQIKNSRDLKADLVGKGTYKGRLPSIVGRYRLLVRAAGKESFIYVDEKAIPAIQKKYGNDFIRNCGQATKDTKSGP